MRRYFWLIPFAMMALAAIACDSPQYTPPAVNSIRADQQNAGTVVLRIQGSDRYFTNPNTYDYVDGNNIDTAYKTTDGGQTWTRVDVSTVESTTPSQHNTFHIFGSKNNYALYWSSSRSSDDGQRFWSYPRPTFISFFQPDGFLSNGESPWFMLLDAPQWDVSAADPHTIYISLGTEGVLVGPTPWDPGPAPRAWKMTRFPELHALPLTLTNPLNILLVVIVALLVPPLPLIHAYLLSRVYRYLFQPGEEAHAHRLARQVALVVTVAAALSVAFWLVTETVDYYPVVALMGVFSVLLSAGIAVMTARKRHFTNKFTRRIGLASAFAGALVPLGVAAIWFLWPFIITGVFGYAILHRRIGYYMERRQHILTNWGLDRLTLEVMALFGLMFIPLGAILFGTNFLGFRNISWPFLLVGALGIIAVAAGAVYLYIRVRGAAAIKKNGPDADAEQSPSMAGLGWWRMLFGSAVVWAVIAAVASGAVFVAQLGINGWFATMLRV